MTMLDHRIATITARIVERSRRTRESYLSLIANEAERGVSRPRLAAISDRARRAAALRS